MSFTVQHNRGDVFLGNNQKSFLNGQIFWSYVNKDRLTSNGHTYSEGQLWIKDPSSVELTEVANRRSIDALKFQGYIDDSFNGDFINANEVTQSRFKHCHVGDFWIFTKRHDTGFFSKFAVGDILLVVDTTYEFTQDSTYRDKLTAVEYIRIPGTKLDPDLTDLDATDVVEATYELEQRLFYKGECSNLESFYNLTRHKGYTYTITKTFYIASVNFEDSEARPAVDNFVQVKTGDLIFYNGSKWILIPTGFDIDDITYEPDEDAINGITTFEDYHKELLKGKKSVREALNILATTKAHINSLGKIPWSELPTSLRSVQSLQGKFYPLIDNTGDLSNPIHQNPWPTPVDPDTGETLEKPENGWTWIVDCNKIKNVQYVDKTQSDRIVELNTGDLIVWVDATNQFEVIDNSDRIAALEVTVPDQNGQTITLVGNVGLTSDGSIQIQTADNTIVLSVDRALVQDEDEYGKKNFVPIYTDRNHLTNSEMYQDTDRFVNFLGFQVGTVSDHQFEHVYGKLGIFSTEGSTKTTFVNNPLFFNTKHTTKDLNTVFTRVSNVYASQRNNYSTGNEELDIYLPELSSTLVGVVEGDSLTPNYHTRTNADGFITDTLTSEILLKDVLLEEAYEDGYENVGIGRTVSEDIDSGEITFYAKSTYKEKTKFGFYVQNHSAFNTDSKSALVREHFLIRNQKVRTHLVINPTILEDEIETFVKMPACSGTLLTWEELVFLFGNPGTPLMIPAWEIMSFRERSFVGLDTSPITIKINRPKSGKTSVDRTNDLAINYGTGNKSTWSYLNSSREGTDVQKDRSSQDDVVLFDAWFEANRAIATKEYFLLPNAAIKDGSSTSDPETLEYTADPENETVNDAYGKNKSDGLYQRILPSRSKYPDEPVYFDSLTGKLKPQSNEFKDVEMPAEGGVLLTSRSRIEGGVWL